MYTSNLSYKLLRQEVWEKEFGNALHGKCPLPNCSIILFKHDDSTFHCGHIIPKSKGGRKILENLRPICSSCNVRMGSYTWDEYEDYVRI
jgi:5-methylcytosine-specific restriction endonuclease McrA